MLLFIQMLKSIHRLITILLVVLLLASPFVAQHKRNAAPKNPVAPAAAPKPAPTFDTLLSADSYKIYGEIRGAGALIHSSAVNDLLDPVMKLAGPPKEFKTVVKWLTAHADALAGSRILVAGWPSRPKLPNFVVAIEFSSPEEAKKFEPDLRGFIPTLLPTPTPAPTPASSPPNSTSISISATIPTARTVTTEETESEPALPPYQIKQAGSLILISDIPFTARLLRPRSSKLLDEDQNFSLARNRFASESLFLYVDLKSIEKEETERRQKWEAEEQKRIDSEAANPAKDAEAPSEMDPSMTATPEVISPQESQELPSPPPPQPDPSSSPQATLGTTPSNPQVVVGAGPAAPDARSNAEAQAMEGAFMSLYTAFFGGATRWPEAVGAAIAFEGDAYVVRTLIVNGPDNKGNAIPFVPRFVSGPALVLEAASVMPADTDLFVTSSLDYTQIYEGMVKAMANEPFSPGRFPRPVNNSEPESPFAFYEKKLGLKIKDDLLPLLGNELAFALPAKPPAANATPSPGSPKTDNSEQKNSASSEPTPIIAIAVKDKEAVRRLIPKLIESLAFKGADLFAQTEKRDGAEIISYANMFSYAFIGDFLVLSPDATVTRHAVDEYLNHQTLSSDSHYRNSTRWQPRQILGQVYVAPELMERYYPAGANGSVPANDKLREFLSRLGPVIDPMTYALSNDGLGPLHELHVPKNLLLLMMAGMSSEVKQSPLNTNEAVAKSALRVVAGAEANYKETKGDGHYGTLDQLIEEKLINKEMLEKYGYRIELTVSGNKFEITAVPLEYGQTGRLSYFVDESAVLRGGDHGGGVATIADQPVQ
ncbi:MAG TPA: hypothetical protein DHU55_15815 [Blastocatellia bacterium]|nr:hypothetical protein [Blastocatellia bacterium]